MSKKDKIKVIITKIGLDTHVSGARIIAHWLREAGMEVTYLGKYQTPEMIVESALQEDVDVIGISCLALSYELIIKVVALLKEKGMDDVLVIAGGTIPKPHALKLKSAGVSEVFFPDSKSDTKVNYVTSHVKKG